MTDTSTVVPLQSPLLLTVPGVVHGFSERTGGVSPPPYASLNFGARGGDALDHVQENRRRFFAALGIAGEPLAIPRQGHTAVVHVVDGSEPLSSLTGDAVITAVPGVALMVLAADCVPVLIADPVQRVVAAVHAGWRGVAGGIVARAVHRMCRDLGCNAGRLLVVLGPAVGPCCYEVGNEVVAGVGQTTPLPASAYTSPGHRGRPHLNLHAALAGQLQAAGVPASHIDAISACTSCDNHRFFSHRREGFPAGRGAAMIQIAPDYSR